MEEEVGCVTPTIILIIPHHASRERLPTDFFCLAAEIPPTHTSNNYNLRDTDTIINIRLFEKVF